MITYLKNILTKDRIIYAGLFFVAILMFFWPIPNTIAVRSISFALSILTLGYLFIKDYKSDFLQLKAFRVVSILIVATTVWFYFVAIVISKETLWSLKELNGQWLMGVFAFVLGILAASLRNGKAIVVFLIVLSMFFVHVFYIDLFAIKFFVANNGIFPIRIEGLTGGCDKANYITNWALAFLGAEIYFRMVKHKRFIPIDSFLLFVCFCLVLASSYFETMRFGFISLIFTFIGFLFLYLIANVKNFSIVKLSLIAFSSIAILLSFLYLGYKADTRWVTLKETLHLALDTKANKAWLDLRKYPMPILSNGEMVSESNYARPAWIKEGVILIAENPFGIGYGRNAFGHAIKMKYGESGVGHSHSGIIDLGVGVGIPGVLLWIAFLGSLMYFGFKSFKQDGSYFGMVLFFIASGFFFRMLADSVIRDHMLEQFMFLAGLLLTLSMLEKNEELSPNKV